LGLGVEALLIPAVAEAAKKKSPPPKKRREPTWHDFSQDKRNGLILARGLDDEGEDGGVCKPWVEEVVSDASKGVVDLPLTTEGGYGCAWERSRDVGTYRQSRIPRPGEILQMKWRTVRRNPDTGGYWTPHTAIVYSISSDEMEWLDSNWLNDLKVRIHSVKWAEFRTKVICYSIYYIL